LARPQGLIAEGQNLTLALNHIANLANLTNLHYFALCPIGQNWAIVAPFYPFPDFLWPVITKNALLINAE